MQKEGVGKGRGKERLKKEKGKCKEDTRGGSHYSEEAVLFDCGK